MPKLVVVDPASGEAAHDLEENSITLGRVSDNNIVIDDSSVSSHHATLTKAENDYVLKDLGSTNGTRLNGEPLTEKKLQDGDIIQFGQVEARYKSESGATRQPMPAVSEKMAAKAAKNSERPSDFTNASPFKTKGKQKDPVGTAVMGLTGLAVLAFVLAVVLIFLVQVPQ